MSGYSVLDTKFSLNGLLATETPVLQNLEKICNAAGAWLTYDIHAGKWSVIINKTGNSVASFDDSNIIGPIRINGTGLYNLYNKVSISFPNADIRDQRDTITLEIPDADRNANEPDNTLNLTYDIVNDPVQAEILGLLELKQSRIDKVIQFNTDFSKIEVKAGDIIDITNSIYGFNQKLFRVVTVREVDSEAGAIDVEITALEYDPAVYSTADLSRYNRTSQIGIPGIGAIAAPSTPIVTKVEFASRPRLLVATVVNSGIVDTTEFWLSYDVGEQFTQDSQRTYILLGIRKPTNGTVFSPDEAVTLDIDTLNESSFLIKCRCGNSRGFSGFSDATGQIYYAPVQTTQAITEDTGLYDNFGNLISAIGALALLSSLLDYFDEETGLTFPGSGGPGGGATFLLLTFNGLEQAQYAGPYDFDGGQQYQAPDGSWLRGYYSIDWFIPLVRIVPPAESSVLSGLDQNYLNQWVTTGNWNSEGSAEQYHSTSWPDIIPAGDQQTQKMIKGLGRHQIGIDLVAYKYYYPDATSLDVEIRGYWNAVYSYWNGSPSGGELPVRGSGAGTAVTVTAHIYTDTYPLNLGVLNSIDNAEWLGYRYSGGSYISESIGTEFYMSNDVVEYVNDPYYGNVATYRFGANGTGTSISTVVTSKQEVLTTGDGRGTNRGQAMAAFSYDFEAEYPQDAPSWGLNTGSVPTYIEVPYTWEWTYDGGTINGIQPASTVRVKAEYLTTKLSSNLYEFSGSWPVGTPTQFTDSAVSVPMSARVDAAGNGNVQVTFSSLCVIGATYDQSSGEGPLRKRIGTSWSGGYGGGNETSQDGEFNYRIYKDDGSQAPTVTGGYYVDVQVL